MVNLVLPGPRGQPGPQGPQVQVDLQGSVVNPDLREHKDQEENQVQMEHLVCNVY